MPETSTMNDTRIITINANKPEPSTIAKVHEILLKGGLVVTPTETTYGLLARVDNKDAVEKLFDAKGRDQNKPSAIFVNDLSELERLAELSPLAKKVSEEFLPGALTIVLKSKSDFGTYFRQSGLTGFRYSSSPIVNAIVKECNFLLSATSANISGQDVPDTVEGIMEQLDDKIDLYLDAGRLNNPVSTVVQIIENELKILRAGAISESEMRKAVM
jgi:L-threonylcarbamoyladenylate synthase